ncbi:membrane protein [Klebsiella pneumoniae]|uniref:Membrane protein n=1 Tax=Klebsiella pneumoniae TaxID=573 RepID=A0A377ZLG1_KLEPN|nr:membrane protein [Klebsiella pneumoniae]
MVQSEQSETTQSQLEELARTLAQQVVLNLAPLMRSETPDEKRINQLLTQLTHNSRVLDAGVYDEQGDLVARSGESVEVRDRLALDGKKAGGYFNQQIVEPVPGKKRPAGLPASDPRYSYPGDRGEAGG